MKFASVILLTILAVGCGGYSSNSTTPPSAAPNISALVPNNTGAGAPAFTLTVNGTAFGSNSVVYFNGAAQPTTHVSTGQVTAMVPATAVANSGTMPVYVRVTQSGQYGGTTTQTSNTVDFTVN